VLAFLSVLFINENMLNKVVLNVVVDVLVLVKKGQCF